MPFSFGVNFRDTLLFVTDGADEVCERGFNYPHTLGGVDCGVLDGVGAAVNRNAGIDRRLAGLHQHGVGHRYRIDLPAAGAYSIRAALGDAESASYGQTANWDLYDDTTYLLTLATGGTAAASFKDATGTQYSSADWPSMNTPVVATFATTVLIVKASTGDLNNIAHLHIEDAETPPEPTLVRVYPVEDITTDGWLPFLPARNLLTFTEAFDNAAWTKVDLTASANAATDPNGVTDAETLVESTNLGPRYVSQSLPDMLVASTSYVLSCYVRANARGWVLLYFVGLSGGGPLAYFNVGTGAVGTVTGGTAAIAAAGNGYYRCSVTADSGTGSTPAQVRVFPTTADGVLSYTGTGVNALDVWGIQFEQGATPTPYQPIIATDPPTSGLPLWSMVNEIVADDDDFIYSPDDPTTEECELKFGGVVDPLSSDDHTLDYRLEAVGQDTDFRLTLMDGATTIAQWHEVVTQGAGVFAGDYTLDGADADAINDYTDLRIRVLAIADSIVGSPAAPCVGRVMWLRLTVPEPAVVEPLYRYFLS